ncbi:uncharacterized protein LOC144103492 [Amblyomma americanum]
MQETNPFLFVIQVRKRFGKTFRSNNLCLILLPCPLQLFEWLCIILVSLRSLLLLAGDVETNPGPTGETIEQQLKAIAKDIQEIKQEKTVTNQKLGSIDKKLEKIGKIEKQVIECVERVDKLEKMVVSLTKTVDDPDNRSRRSNLIIYGIEEQENETPQSLQDTVEKIFDEKLEIKTAGFERIHRLGRKEASDDSIHRPVILKLFDYRDKTNILGNCTMLKQTGYKIGEDFSRAVREVRKKLWERTKVNRDQKDKVYLKYDKIKINERLYTWDEEKRDIIEIPKKISRAMKLLLLATPWFEKIEKLEVGEWLCF